MSPTVRTTLIAAAAFLLGGGAMVWYDSRAGRTPANSGNEPAFDADLRSFFSVQSVQGRYTFPASSSAAYSTMLYFVDGKEVARVPGSLHFWKSATPPSNYRVALMWRHKEGMISDMRLLGGGNEIDVQKQLSEKALYHWPKLAEYITSYRSIPQSENLVYDGVHILGIFASKKYPEKLPGTNPNVGPFINGDFMTGNDYVIALGVIHGPEEKIRSRFENLGQK